MAGPPGSAQRDAQKFIVFENFEKMNTQSVRQALSEKELAWLENLQPIAGNNLATVPAPNATPFVTIPENIDSAFYASISATDYIIAFTTAGAGFAINLGTGLATQFAPDGTFTNPDVTTWQDSIILINDPTAGYSTYNGSAFIHQGTVSPVITVTAGGAYSSPPTVTISGGSGSGATAIAILSGSSVVAVQLTNAGIGYKVGDTLTVTFTAPPGGGATGHAVLSGASVTGVSINDSGQMFISPGPGNVPLIFSGGGGTGAAGIATVQSLGPGLGTNVVGVTLTNGGSGYSSAPSCTIANNPGPGHSPTFNVFISGQSVTALILDSGGSLYVVPPTVLISGGGGSGAFGHSTISGGAVNSLVLDSGGGGYTSIPSVTIGGGSSAAASAHVWPFVPAGTTLAVFQGRVWLGGGTLLQYTGTEGYDDFDSAHAAGSLEITDADLVHAITALRSYNNYLYIMGDQSVKQIGNISLNSAGDITLFTILTLSSDQGTIYPHACVSFNRVFMFLNSNGVYAVLGSSVQKISDDMDGIFKLIDFSQPPAAALADITNIHNVTWLVRYRDPLSATRSILITFTGKKWFVISQGDGLSAIATSASLATGKTSVYGSSGKDLTQLLANSALPVKFKAQSALTHHGNAVQRKGTIRAGYAVTATGLGSLLMTIESDEGALALTEKLMNGFQAMSYSGKVAGRYLGMTLTGNLAGLTVTNMTIEMQESNLGNRDSN